MFVRGVQYGQSEEEGWNAGELRVDRGRGVLERGGETAGCARFVLRKIPYRRCVTAEMNHDVWCTVVLIIGLRNREREREREM